MVSIIDFFSFKNSIFEKWRKSACGSFYGDDDDTLFPIQTFSILLKYFYFVLSFIT